MYLNLDWDDRRRLTRLVERRIREVDPEIRRRGALKSREELKQEVESLQRLLHRLHEAECDVSA